MTHVRRRTFQNEPEEKLLLTSDPLAFVTRFDEFIDTSGLPPERVLATPLIATPLPVATVGEDSKLARWEGANASFMWHPLMWLPPHLALRYRYRIIDDTDGGTDEDTETEPDDIWAIRVALELVYSGLYNPDDGTWLDVLAFHGLDTGNPVDLARVEAWLEGASDEILDSIDLTSIVVNDDNPEWALRSAKDLSDTLIPAQWALTAATIIDTVENVREHAGDDGDAGMLNVFTQVAAQSLRAVPADPETGIDSIDMIGVLREEFHEPDSDPAALLDAFVDLLRAVVSDYRPYLEAVMGEPQLQVEA